MVEKGHEVIVMKMNMNEDDLEEITYDELEDEDEDELALEEGEKTKPWVMLATFGALVVLAAIICAVLWRFTHSNNNDGALTGSNLPTESVTDTLALEPSEGMSESVVGNETEGDMGASGEPAQEQEPSNGTTQQTGSENPDGQETGTEQNGSSPSSQPVEPENTVDEPVSGTTAMEFTEANDEVTAKDVTNLRSAPSTVDSENVVAQLKNGDKILRTGTNSTTGWSRLSYNGETVYAVTQFLTTDLSYKPPVAASDPNRITTQDGRVIIFTDCSDNITPKEYVNLRTEPSTSQGEATVACQVKSGETVLRTGYSTDSGWSRVEYNGQVLYVVSSLMKAAE